MFPITRKGSSYFVSGGEKGISFFVSTSKRLRISNFGTRRDCRQLNTPKVALKLK